MPGILREMHGLTQSIDYKVWSQVVERCCNPNCDAYKNYGGRGIAICSRWRESFLAFHEDMGPRPSLKHSIDRIDNERGYEPGNCRWATRKEQSRNSRHNHILNYAGLSLCISEWAEMLGITPHTIYHRVYRNRPMHVVLAEYEKQWVCAASTG